MSIRATKEHIDLSSPKLQLFRSSDISLIWMPYMIGEAISGEMTDNGQDHADTASVLEICMG